MRRRSRSFRRPAPLQRPRRPVPPVVRRMLMRAHRAAEKGQYAEAAEVYDRLAREAYTRARVRPGVHMDLEAARCYLRSGEVDAARARLSRAAHRAVVVGYPLRCRPLVEQIVQRLEAAGRPGEAAQFHSEMAELLQTLAPEPSEVPTSASRSVPPRLPGSCPACSAPLHPEDLTWVAADRVTCPYCGTVVVAE
ncbi:MAG: hypothetical protein ACP5HM_08560 [Anaerolineae bacterium]